MKRAKNQKSNKGKITPYDSVMNLEKELLPFAYIKANRPTKGWISEIRKTQGMTSEYLGSKIQTPITAQGISALEESERNGTISLNSLEKVGKAMKMKLVYGFAPEKEKFSEVIENMILPLAMIKFQEINPKGLNERQKRKFVQRIIKNLFNETKKEFWERFGEAIEKAS